MGRYLVGGSATRPSTENAHRFPTQLPEALAGALDAACRLDGVAELALVVGDAHADHIVSASAWPALAWLPLHDVDHELDGLQPAPRLRIVEVANADEPLAEAGDELLGPGHAGAEGQAGFHRPAGW